VYSQLRAPHCTLNSRGQCIVHQCSEPTRELWLTNHQHALDRSQRAPARSWAPHPVQSRTTTHSRLASRLHDRSSWRHARARDVTAEKACWTRRQLDQHTSVSFPPCTSPTRCVRSRCLCGQLADHASLPQLREFSCRCHVAIVGSSTISLSHTRLRLMIPFTNILLITLFSHHHVHTSTHPVVR
jgi:hypothetical protein